MHLVDIDDVGPEPFQRSVDLGEDSLTGSVPKRLAIGPVEPDLGGDRHSPSPTACCERFSDDLFRLAEAVHRRGVDQSNSAIDRGMDRADRLLFISAAPHPSTHRPRAQTDARKLKIRAGYSRGFHIFSFDLTFFCKGVCRQNLLDKLAMDLREGLVHLS